MRKLLSVGIVAAIAVFAWRQHRANPRPDIDYSSTPAPEIQSVESAVVQTSFKCDGRKRCKEMTSCEEARCFVQNCADVEMDGDHDGFPCEDWCGHGQ